MTLQNSSNYTGIKYFHFSHFFPLLEKTLGFFFVLWRTDEQTPEHKTTNVFHEEE